MSAVVRGRSQSSEEDHIRAGAAMDALIGMLIEIVDRALPPDGVRPNAALAGAVELMVRCERLKSMSNNDVAMAMGLGMASALMHRPDGPNRIFYPVPVMQAFIAGIITGIEEMVDDPTPPSAGMTRQ